MLRCLRTTDLIRSIHQTRSDTNNMFSCVLTRHHSNNRTSPCTYPNSNGISRVMLLQTIGGIPSCCVFVPARFMTKLSGRTRSPYEVLGVFPNSSQAEIKAAYYRLSKEYHPDVNVGDSNAVQKFRDITEAYEILGQFSTRRKYDKGEIEMTGGIIRERPSEYSARPSSGAPSQSQRSERPPLDRRNFNYDEWTRQHYTELFHRRIKQRELHRSNVFEQEDMHARNADGRVVALAALFLGFSFMCIYVPYKYYKIMDTPVRTKKS